MFGTRTDRGRKHWVPKDRSSEYQGDETEEHPKPYLQQKANGYAKKEERFYKNSDFYDNSVPSRNHLTY